MQSLYSPAAPSAEMHSLALKGSRTGPMPKSPSKPKALGIPVSVSSVPVSVSSVPVSVSVPVVAKQASRHSVKPLAMQQQQQQQCKASLQPKVLSASALERSALRNLTVYEAAEVSHYANVYYTGLASTAKVGSAKRRTGADLADVFNVSGTFFSLSCTRLYRL